MKEPFILLRTKLNLPRPSGELIIRPRLIEKMSRGMDRSMTLISAPAGYGKTTLAATWIHAIQLPYAWLSLDEDDNDFFVFLNYLLASIRSCFPQACSESYQLLNSQQTPPLTVFLERFTKDISEIEKDFVLILDDYHYVTQAVIHQFITHLIQHPIGKLHIVLATRRDPPLPISRWRACGSLLEVRASDLRFNIDESYQFLRSMLEKHILPETLEAVDETTEGWIVGLRLVALAMRRNPDYVANISAIKQGKGIDVREYLMDEVLQHQPQWLQGFLLQISILDRICAPLCEKLLSGKYSTEKDYPISLADYPSTDFQSILDNIDRANLFFERLDQQGRWYRFHPLFREMLNSRLEERYSPSTINNLHFQASRWFAERGYIDDALHHALAGHDDSLAAEIVESNFFRALDMEERQTARRWLAQLPKAIFRSRPALLLAQAWEYDHQQNYAAIPELLDQATRILESNDPPLSAIPIQELQGQIAALRAQHLFSIGWIVEGLDEARRALLLLPEHQLYLRSQALMYLGLGLQMNGKSVEAEHELLQATQDHYGQVNTFYLHALNDLCLIFHLQGDLSKMHHTAERMLKLSQQAELPPMQAWAYTNLGAVYYEWNELELARIQFNAGVELAYLAHPLPVEMCLTGLTLTLQAQGREKDAIETLAKLENFQQNRTHLPEETLSLKARLALSHGDIYSAMRWSLSLSEPKTPTLKVFPEIPFLTYCRVCISQQLIDEPVEIAADLQSLLEEVENNHNVWRTIEVLAMQTLVLYQEGKEQQALITLARAIDLAQPSNFVRSIVDVGEGLVPCLEKLLSKLSHDKRPGKSRGTIEYISRILAAFQCSMKMHEVPYQNRFSTEENVGLTGRELEILSLLGKRLSNQEIAEQLVLSLGSVKQYTHKIYVKLDAASRRQAVIKARTLRIIP